MRTKLFHFEEYYMILIEGIPGSGKSTTAINLKKELQLKKVDCKLFLEYSDENPFRYKNGTSPEVPVQDFVSTVSSQWKLFFDKYSNKNKMIIQEGMTLQQQVNYAVWIDRFIEIKPLIQEILNGLKKIQPTLFYLEHRKPEENFQRVMQERGNDWVTSAIKPISESPFAVNRNIAGVKALQSFLEEITKKNLECLSLLDFPVHRINIGDYDEDSLIIKILSVLNL